MADDTGTVVICVELDTVAVVVDDAVDERANLLTTVDETETDDDNI